MGPMSIRVASYFPFNVTCYFNGHSFAAQELTRAGIRFRKADNAFLGVADVAALEAAANRVSAALLAALATPTLVGQRRIPGLKLHDDRVIRLLETLLHPGGFVGDWTTRDVHARVMARHRLTETDYRLSQLRYDLTKLRAKGFVERLGTSRRYR